jgi:hypothetical protein
MALTERNGIWHWRKVVQGHRFARSTKTGDKKLASQIAARWESEAITEIVLKGTKPVLLHSVIKAFLDARGREGTPMRRSTSSTSSPCRTFAWVT